MKKLLLLAAFAIGVSSVNAQTLTVTVGGNEVQNGATVESYDVDADYWNYDHELQLYPSVYATSSETAEYTISVTNTATDPDTPAIQFCWPMLCYTAAPGQTVSSSGTLEAGKKSKLSIYTVPVPITDEPFSTSCSVLIKSGSLNFSFNINMHYDPEIAGVGGIEAEDAQPVYYNLNGVQVANPDHGIFIVKKGSKISKVVL